MSIYSSHKCVCIRCLIDKGPTSSCTTAFHLASLSVSYLLIHDTLLALTIEVKSGALIPPCLMGWIMTDFLTLGILYFQRKFEIIFSVSATLIPVFKF